MKELNNYCKKIIEKNPSLKNEILDLYLLCWDNIEEGASIENEIENCYSAIKDLL